MRLGDTCKFSCRIAEDNNYIIVQDQGRSGNLLVCCIVSTTELGQRVRYIESENMITDGSIPAL